MAIDIARAIGAAGNEIVPANNHAGLWSQLGRVDAGRAMAERAYGLLEQVGDPTGLSASAALNTLGLFNQWQGRLDLALECFTRGLEKLGGVRGTSRHASVENNLVLTWLYLGQPTRALQALTAISDAAAVQAPAICGRRHHIEARIDRAL